MKQTLKIMIGISLLTVLYSFTPNRNKNLSGLTDVSLDNIDALSSRANYPTVCYGEGTIDCAQYKVDFKTVYYK